MQFPSFIVEFRFLLSKKSKIHFLKIEKYLYSKNDLKTGKLHIIENIPYKKLGKSHKVSDDVMFCLLFV